MWRLYSAGVGPASETFNSVVSVARGQRSQQTSKSTLDTFHPRFPSCLTICVIYIKLFDDTRLLEQTDTPNEAGGGGKRGRGEPRPAALRLESDWAGAASQAQVH